MHLATLASFDITSLGLKCESTAPLALVRAETKSMLINYSLLRYLGETENGEPEGQTEESDNTLRYI